MSMNGDSIRSNSWQPLREPDLAAIGFATCVSVGMALLAFHVVLHRAWLPYKASIPSLVACTALAGVLATLASTLRYGFWGSTTLDTPRPVGCGAEACFAWLGGAALFCCGYLRVHRYYSVLVHYKTSMLPVLLQFSMALLPFAVPAVLVLVRPSLVPFDVHNQECENETGVLSKLVLGILSVLAVASLALTLRLHSRRMQAPEEFFAAVTTSASMIFGIATIVIFHVSMEEERADRRRAILVVVSLTAAGIFAPPLLRPLAGYIRDEEGFECSGDYGFREAHQQEKTRGSLQMFVEMNALAISPMGRMIPSSDVMVDFYQATLSREVMQDYFLLQASTMRILDTYVREGASNPVPLSAECRNSTLCLRATSTVIFTQARSEILADFRSTTRCKTPPYSTTNTHSKSVVMAPETGSADSPFPYSDTSSKFSGSIESFHHPPPMSATTTSSCNGYSLSTHGVENRFFGADAEEKMSTPVSTRCPSERDATAPTPQRPAGLPPRPPQRSASVASDQTLPRSARKSLERFKLGSPAVPSEGRRQEGALLPSRSVSSSECTMDYSKREEEKEEEEEVEEEEKHDSTPMREAREVRVPSFVLGALQAVSGATRYVSMGDEAADELETRKPSLGEASVKTMAAVDDLQVAFGLRSESGSSEDESDGRTSKRRRGVDHHRSDTKSRGESMDLAEASRAIGTPIFGSTSRAVGRQPERKMKTSAWWDFATRKMKASRGTSNETPSSSVCSTGGDDRGGDGNSGDDDVVKSIKSGDGFGIKNSGKAKIVDGKRGQGSPHMKHNVEHGRAGDKLPTSCFRKSMGSPSTNNNISSFEHGRKGDMGSTFTDEQTLGSPPTTDKTNDVEHGWFEIKWPTSSEKQALGPSPTRNSVKEGLVVSPAIKDSIVSETEHDGRSSSKKGSFSEEQFLGPTLLTTDNTYDVEVGETRDNVSTVSTKRTLDVLPWTGDNVNDLEQGKTVDKCFVDNEEEVVGSPATKDNIIEMERGRTRGKCSVFSNERIRESSTTRDSVNSLEDWRAEGTRSRLSGEQTAGSPLNKKNFSKLGGGRIGDKWWMFNDKQAPDSPPSKENLNDTGHGRKDSTRSVISNEWTQGSPLQTMNNIDAMEFAETE